MEPEGFSQQGPVRIMLWCYPRTLSTVLTKCLSFIESLEVWFEPFTYCDIANTAYRMETGQELPREYSAENAKEFEVAAASIIKRLGLSSTSVAPDRIAYGSVKQCLESTQSRLVFVKDMSLAVWNESLRDYIPSGYQHVFLIRDPRSALRSFRKACIIRDKPLDETAYDVVRDDVFLSAEKFFPSLHELWMFIRQNVDPDPMVINADDLTTTPGGVLKKFCNHTGLPYSDALLHWDASSDVIGRWKACGDTLVNEIPIFFHDAATSSEFIASTSKPITNEDLTDDVLRLVDTAMPLYEEMNENAAIQPQKEASL